VKSIGLRNQNAGMIASPSKITEAVKSRVDQSSDAKGRTAGQDSILKYDS